MGSPVQACCISRGFWLEQVFTIRPSTCRLIRDVIFHSYSGLRVPREAVCYSEETGSAGVYVLEGAKAVWKDIQLLYDNGDTYIAALDQSSTERR